MVRLQLTIKYPSLSLNEESQFHYGSITTLVVLRLFIIILVQSQFHYGSITTCKICSKSNSNSWVSIPLWFDYNLNEKEIKKCWYLCLNSTMVRLQLKRGEFSPRSFFWSQFHYGSITTLKLSSFELNFKVVSIPLWFDYNLPSGRPCTLFFPSLNSTMVRLQQYHIEELFHMHRSLNSTMVRLQLFALFTLTYVTTVSIPLWFDYNTIHC